MAEHIYTLKDIRQRFSSVKGLTLGQIDSKLNDGHDFKRTRENAKITGIAGDVVEHSILGYESDTKQAADIKIDEKEFEVKTTGLVGDINKPSTLKAKERITITNVSPNKLIHEDFETSTLWDKLKNTLLVYYLYDSDKPVQASEYANFPFLDYQLHNFSDADKKVIMNDWKIIYDFCIKQEKFDKKNEEQAKAYSSAKKAMMYLETAPGWKNGPRFALKKSYVNSIIQERFKNVESNNENLVSSFSELDEFLSKSAAKYKGLTVKEIATRLNISSTSKSFSSRLVKTILEPDVSKGETGIVEKSGMVIKARTVYTNGRKKEDCKFETIDLSEFKIPNIDVTETEIYRYFDNTQFIFSIFEKELNGQNENDVFVGFKRFSFPGSYLEDNLKQTLERVNYLIANKKLRVNLDLTEGGKPKRNSKAGTLREIPNFPKSEDYDFFLRGTGRDSRDKNYHINGCTIYKQQIWIKGQSLLKLLEDVEYI